MGNTPNIRFKGFTNDWEQRKLSEFVDKAVDNRGKTPPLDENGTHPLIECQTAHCGRCKPRFVLGEFTSPIVPYRNLPQTPGGMTADCRSLV